MPELRYRDERGESVSVELKDRELVIGRLPECDIVLAKPYVSRRHARVFQEEGVWYVEDLGSAGGTFLNRAPLSSRGALNDGDEIGIGDLRVTFALAGVRTLPSARAVPGDARKTMLGPSPIDGDALFAATNPGYVLPVPGAASSPAAPASEREVRVRQEAAKGAWAKLFARSRVVDPAKVLLPSERTGSLVDAGIAGSAVRLVAEIAAGADRAGVYRRALHVVLRATRGDRAAMATRRDADGAYITVASVVMSGTKPSDATFPIDPELITEVLGTKEGIVAHEGGTVVPSAETVRSSDVRTLLCVPFLEKERVVGWVYADARGLRTDLGANALDLLSFAGAAAAHIGSLK